MPTFLQLCQRVRQECGVAGDGPSSVLSQVGILKKIVDRTQRAWVDIQASPPYWKFLRNQLEHDLTIGQREYNVRDDFLLTTVDKWNRDSSFIYETSTADENNLTWVEYTKWRRKYRTFAEGRPTELVETLDGNIAFNRTPDVAYHITLDYWMTPELLSANDDIPACPEHFHDVIVWKSVMLFSGNVGAPELYNHAKAQYTPMYNKLMVDQGDMPTRLGAYPIALGMNRLTAR